MARTRCSVWCLRARRSSFDKSALLSPRAQKKNRQNKSLFLISHAIACAQSFLPVFLAQKHIHTNTCKSIPLDSTFIRRRWSTESGLGYCLSRRGRQTRPPNDSALLSPFPFSSAPPQLAPRPLNTQNTQRTTFVRSRPLSLSTARHQATSTERARARETENAHRHLFQLLSLALFIPSPRALAH